MDTRPSEQKKISEGTRRSMALAQTAHFRIFRTAYWTAVIGAFIGTAIVFETVYADKENHFGRYASFFFWLAVSIAVYTVIVSTWARLFRGVKS